jgi:hypothetical protein
MLRFRSLPFKSDVITTNWDPFLELALKQSGLRNYKKCRKKDDPIGNGAEIILYKLHGDVGENLVYNDDELVFFDGWNLYCAFNNINPKFKKRIKEVLSENPIVFIGYSGNYDDHVIKILKTNKNFHISIRKSNDACPINRCAHEIHCDADTGLFLLLTKFYQKNDFLYLLDSILGTHEYKDKFLMLINKLQSNAKHIFKNEQNVKNDLQMLERWIVNERTR